MLEEYLSSQERTMTQTVERILAQIDALSIEEQGELVSAFLRNFEPNPEVEAAWEAEVQRRWTQVREQKQKGTPATELFAELRKRSRP
jgi:putative addiction module component (TIGR02574 family)